MNGQVKNGAHPINHDAVVCNGERPLLEAIGMTAERLQNIERRLEYLHGVMYGHQPKPDCCEGLSVQPSVYSCAMDAFGTAVRAEKLVEELIHRTEC